MAVNLLIFAAVVIGVTAALGVNGTLKEGSVVVTILVVFLATLAAVIHLHCVSPDDHLPPERKAVLVWCDGGPGSRSCLPYCGYVRYASGDQGAPYFVVYHGNPRLSAKVIAWCDCLPVTGPEWADCALYNSHQPHGRGFPERPRVTAPPA